jgi:hypothetical protein
MKNHWKDERTVTRKGANQQKWTNGKTYPVNLVANEQFDAIFIRAVQIDFLEPILNILERFAIGDVVHQRNAMRSC